jgi:hypothetical protein
MSEGRRLTGSKSESRLGMHNYNASLMPAIKTGNLHKKMLSSYGFSNQTLASGCLRATDNAQKVSGIGAGGIGEKFHVWKVENTAL